MECSIFTLVDAGGHVYVKDGAVSHSEVAANFGLNLKTCDTYRFDLNARRVMVDHGTPANDSAARSYWEQQLGNPEKLMAFAVEGHLTKQVLGTLLAANELGIYLNACTVIERKYTVDCTKTDDPCLQGGCALEGEVCLEPLLRAGRGYHKACGAAWRTLFEDPQHRAQAWVH